MRRFETGLYDIPNISRDDIEIAHDAADIERIRQVTEAVSSLGIVVRQFPPSDVGRAGAYSFVRDRLRMASDPQGYWPTGYVMPLTSDQLSSAVAPITLAYDKKLPVFRITATANTHVGVFRYKMAERRNVQ